MRVLKNYQRTVCGLDFNNLWRVMKIKTKKQPYYSYQVKDVFGEGFFNLFRSKNKIFGLTKLTMPAIMVLCNVSLYLIILLIYLPKRYFNGGYWFIRNTSWYQDVVFFGWANIFIIIAMALFLIF